MSQIITTDIYASMTFNAISLNRHIVTLGIHLKYIDGQVLRGFSCSHKLEIKRKEIA